MECLWGGQRLGGPHCPCAVRATQILVSKVIRFDGREMNASLTIIISVHPEHARNIMAGKKTVELRRRFPQETVVCTENFIRID